MAINVQPEITSVPLNVYVESETGTYTAEAVQIGEFDQLYLEDIATGVVTDLN